MDKKEYTDEEILKAFYECNMTDHCKDCPLFEEERGAMGCTKIIYERVMKKLYENEAV